ncbi:alpha/beta hydrolase family protein [Noviherbaspirillum denitrificans]|uniref:Peptidase S9 prolyl oligopeptidase catalytic domain-containing protein n=1 Tax=Noviherbaspirillum denitrificans TaxID=1968433 RepID=A0A254TF85_9BURK|nr:alpha/beta hydrolase [Noviherbaspirillum denitrificans]OWW18338.1 hypothetical protein AYR66_02515 [Noviherbaspirillum denitrificans]
MPAPARFLALLCLLLLQACSHFERPAGEAPVSAHTYRFEDGGTARYYVVDKRPTGERPSTYLFVIPGSDCGSMGSVLPGYFDGLAGRDGGMRIFLLHKRFVGPVNGACSDAFTRADHPSRWLADQAEFIRAELAAASANGQFPQRVALAGMSEGAEIVPILARDISGVTHVALIANGGMDPFDAYRLQLQRNGLQHALADVARLCASPSEGIIAAERSCRYWVELQAIRHTENLLALRLPVFMAMGEADTAVPVESAWHIRDRFAERGKKNLHLLTVPGAGHDFRQDGKSRLPYVWEAFEHWLQK